MADIFGREPDDYTIVQALREDNAWERYQQEQATRRPQAAPVHDFGALNAGVPKAYERAAEDAQAVGYVTNNLLAIQTMVDEILYTAYRLPDFVSIDTSIPEGARSFGVRVMQRVGSAQRISAPGYEAPSATVSEALVTQDMHWYGLDAEWSVDELRGAMLAGTPLDTESIEAAVTGCLETMEEVGLTGGDYDDKGLLNQPITGSNAVTQSTASKTFTASTATEIRDLINGELSKVIENSKETMGRNIRMGMTVYLPGAQYDSLTTKYVGDNAERTVMRSILEDNPWTHFTGNPVNIQRVLELDSIAASNQDRMVVALKNPRVATMGVSITPRVLKIIDKGRVVCGQVEAKFSPLFVKRPNTIHYVDNI